MSKIMSTLLINETPILLSPSLVKELGLKKAVVLTQVNTAIQQTSNPLIINNVKYVGLTDDQWATHYFTFWNVRTVRRYLKLLQKQGSLLARQHNKMMFYGINHTGLDGVGNENTTY